MSLSSLMHPAPEAGVRTIGLPRALGYYRYGQLWETFFTQLGHTCVLSRPTDKALLQDGAALAVDETCLSGKIYLGHVADLLGRCDRIFVPRLAGFGAHAMFCTRFEALPDLVENLPFPQAPELLRLNIDYRDKSLEKDAFLHLGEKLGHPAKAVKAAYRAAAQAQEQADTQAQKALEKMLKQPGTKILLAGHGYLLHDPYIGGGIAQTLREMGATVLYSDHADRAASVKQARSFSPTLPWLLNQEQLGAILLLKDKVDGVVLLSAFPCGPDSMVNDILLRQIKGLPILQLTLDAQDGLAGLETRLESFVDILHYQKEAGYGI